MTTTLVTGASSGIGAALAHRFAAEGHALVLVARREERLRTLAAAVAKAHGVKAHVVAMDVTEPGAPARLLASCRRRKLDVDILVNNAGVLDQGPFADMTMNDHLAMIDLNVRALTGLIALFLPGMRERGSGRILNVASIASFQPVPHLATYAATKAYVLSLTESLAEELRDSGVTITALCPGITATEMLSGAADANPVLSKLSRAVVGDAADVADLGVRGCLRGDVIVVPGAVNLAATLAARATPKWLLRKVSGAIVRRSRS